MFEIPNEDSVSYVGTLDKATPSVILALQARRCIEDGASTFLVMVVDKQ